MSDRYIEICQKRVEEMAKRVEAGDVKGLSFVDIMKPSQNLYNALMFKMGGQFPSEAITAPSSDDQGGGAVPPHSKETPPNGA